MSHKHFKPVNPIDLNASQYILAFLLFPLILTIDVCESRNCIRFLCSKFMTGGPLTKEDLTPLTDHLLPLPSDCDSAQSKL